MRRVSSRQRLVSWDAFDANDPDCHEISSDEFSFASCHSSHDDDDVLRRCASEDSSNLKRKRSSRLRKTTPAAVESPPTTTASLKTSSSAATLTSSHDSTASLISAYEWELPPAATLNALNDDVQLQILEFCDTAAVRNMMQVNHRYRNLISSHEAMALWKEVCHRQWPWLDATTDLVDSFHLPTVAVVDDADHADMANLALLLSLAAEHKATAIDESAFAATTNSHHARHRHRPRPLQHNPSNTVELKVLQVPTSDSKTSANTTTTTAVQYTGPVGMGDRCIRADQPLPRPALLSKASSSETAPSCPKHRSLLQRLSRFSKHHSLRHGSKRNNQEATASNKWRPFVAPYTGQGSTPRRQVHLTPRLVSYFEVSVLGKPSEDDTTTAAAAAAPAARHFDFQAHVGAAVQPAAAPAAECVAIGVATAEFSLHTRMPGWDRFSFGYHGDDGGIFHGHGNMVKQYGPKYGVGDTVGCGIDYVQGAIFFTLNGKFLGNAFENLSQEELQHDFFPVVGMDTHCPVTCNFGCERPFVFDLNAMITQQQRSVILQSMR